MSPFPRAEANEPEGIFRVNVNRLRGPPIPAVVDLLTDLNKENSTL